MTREEALCRVKGYLTDIIPTENYSEVEEIIKALEQQPIPNNATNGDIVQMMFPNVNVYEHNGGATYSVNNEYNFNATWWNAPYQKGGKE